MNIGIGKRSLVISVEKAEREPVDAAALIGATDREVEQFARKRHAANEPRWEVPTAFFGYRI